MKKTFIAIAVIAICSMAFKFDGGKIPVVIIKNLDGSKVSTATFTNNGKPIIISFWATWCKPCKKELDNIFTQIKPIDIPVVVYRGIPLSDISDYNTSLQYQSTTFDLARASSATTPKLCCIFSITIPVGIKAIITNNSQQEVILNRNVGVVVNDKNPLSYVNMKAVFASSAISTDFQSVENFIKNQQDIYKDTKKTKQTIIDNHKRSDIDKIIQDLYEKISLEDDIDPEDFSAKLGISTDQMEKLIDDIKENEMDENEIKDAITKL